MRTYTIEVEVEDPNHRLSTEQASDYATMLARQMQAALVQDEEPVLEVTGVRVSRYTESEVHAGGGVIRRDDVEVPSA